MVILFTHIIGYFIYHHLSTDGNAWSARLGKLLCFNSVVIKVQPEFVGYWEKEIKPWV
jgi:hypothetical protein